MKMGQCTLHRIDSCPECSQRVGATFQTMSMELDPMPPPTVPGFRVAISAPLNPKGQVPFETEIAALAACIRELSTLDHESRHRMLVNLVDRFEERRKL